MTGSPEKEEKSNRRSTREKSPNRTRHKKKQHREKSSHRRRRSSSRSRYRSRSRSPRKHRNRSTERSASEKRHKKSRVRSRSRSKSSDEKGTRHREKRNRTRSRSDLSPPKDTSKVDDDKTSELPTAVTVPTSNAGGEEASTLVEADVQLAKNNVVDSIPTANRPSDGLRKKLENTVNLHKIVSIKLKATKPSDENKPNAEPPSEKKPPTAADNGNTLDVSAIQQNILKALAQARNAAAVAGIAAGNIKESNQTQLVEESWSEQSQHQSASNNVFNEVKPMETDGENPPETHPGTQGKMEISKEVPEDVQETPREQIKTESEKPFDMFAISSIEEAAEQVVVNVPTQAPGPSRGDDPGLQSNWDDADGYYKTIVGEVLRGRYQVLGNIGKGVFSTVLKCTDMNDASGKIVAVKIVRNNDTMRKAAQMEQQLLEELALTDKQIFEPLSMNLREAMKKFGGKGGIQLNAVRIFTKQLLIALYHLQSCKVIHADIKPDNVLVNEKYSYVKLCDFGSAFRLDSPDNLPTPYLVSRYYRAPEIILGFPYDYAIDMWSVGCCIYEMFTGKVLFPGATNNDMLRLFMELRGRFPSKMIRRHRTAFMTTIEREPHFEEDCRFRSYELDRVTGKPVLRVITVSDPVKNLGSMLLAAKTTSDDRKMIMHLKDLLENIFVLDPTKRISVKEALAHPFVKGEGKQGK